MNYKDDDKSTVIAAIIGFGAIALTFGWVGFLIWVIYQLVTWVISK